MPLSGLDSVSKAENQGSREMYTAMQRERVYNSLSTGPVAWAQSKVKVRAYILQMEWDQKGDWEGNHGGKPVFHRHSSTK